MPDLSLPRQALGFFPTPLVPLRFLSRPGGARFWIKRDDLTGLALGGNKTRKLEYLFAEALAQGCDAVLTAGAAQSNHCRQTAAAAASLGLPCHLALGGEAPDRLTGNLLLDDLFGAKIHWCGASRKGERIPEIAESLRACSLRPYVVPYGGSSPTGAAGFVAARLELEDQLRAAGFAPDAIVFASSSGGTHAGLMVGAALTGGRERLIGIAIDKVEEQPFDEVVADLAGRTAGLLGVDFSCRAADVHLERGFATGGYGAVGEFERNAIHEMARREGILLDPVYTGRAFGALLALVAEGAFAPGENVIFWHTGGTPALFA